MKTIEFSPKMIAAAKAVFMAKAWTATVRPVVEGYQREILALHNWHVAKRWIDRGITDRIIIESKDTYLMEDKDFETYHQEGIEARKKAKLKVSEDGNCPLLVAENMERQAIRAMLTAMMPITKIDPDDVYGENWNKLTDLTLRLLAPYVK